MTCIREGCTEIFEIYACHWYPSVSNLRLMNNWNHYFGLGLIPKPKIADTVGPIP